jgi:DMSO/TMAO reductase YedYZ heme-binding membrane subunit
MAIKNHPHQYHSDSSESQERSKATKAAKITALIGLVLFAYAVYLSAPRAYMVSILNSFLSIGQNMPWHLSRSAGTVGYMLLVGSTVWGLLLSSKIVKKAVPAVLSLAMHNILSWLALAFTGLHALVLLFDSYYTYTISNLLVPFTGPYRPIWVGLGIIGFYLMALVTLSFQFRRRIGQENWRALHYLSFVVYALATIHGAASGTDGSKLGMQFMYVGSGLLVLILIGYRLWTAYAARMRLGQAGGTS